MRKRLAIGLFPIENWLVGRLAANAVEPVPVDPVIEPAVDPVIEPAQPRLLLAALPLFSTKWHVSLVLKVKNPNLAGNTAVWTCSDLQDLQRLTSICSLPQTRLPTKEIAKIRSE